METGICQQPVKKAENSPKLPTGLQRSEKISHPEPVLLFVLGDEEPFTALLYF